MEKPLDNLENNACDPKKNDSPKQLSSEEKIPTETCTDNLKPKAPKAKKRKKPKDSTAPRQPLTGNISNVLFLQM